jgi:hypothetical protein
MRWIVVILSLVIAVASPTACNGESATPETEARKTTGATGADNKALPKRGAVPAGEYATDEFEPAFSFRVGKGWQMPFPEENDVLGIVIEQRGAGVFFTKTQTVYDPSNPSQMEEVPAPQTPHEWISWFEKHPNLNTTKPQPVTVGGASGLRIDVVAGSAPRDYPIECGTTPCVELYPFADIGMASYIGIDDRYIVIDVNGEAVIIDVGAPSDEFEGFLPRAQEVLDTVEWKDAS